MRSCNLMINLMIVLFRSGSVISNLTVSLCRRQGAPQVGQCHQVATLVTLHRNTRRTSDYSRLQVTNSQSVSRLYTERVAATRGSTSLPISKLQHSVIKVFTIAFPETDFSIAAL